MKHLAGFFALFLLLAGSAPAHAQAPFLASGPTVSLAVTGTTGRVAVAVDAFNPAIRLYNAGTVAVFVACGDVTVLALTTTSMPVAPGTVEVVGCSKGYVAGITASGTATLYVTPGSGL